MCTAAVHLGLQIYNWRIEVQDILLLNLAWDYSAQRVTCYFPDR